MRQIPGGPVPDLRAAGVWLDPLAWRRVPGLRARTGTVAWTGQSLCGEPAVAVPVQDSPGQQASAQAGTELIGVIAVAGQCPGQEPCVAFGDEYRDADE